MTSPLRTFLSVGLLLVQGSIGVSKEWYENSAASATTGPGAGMGGVEITDASVNTGETFLDAILTNVENMVSVTGNLTGGKGGQNDELREIQEAIGKTTEGIDVAPLKYEPDPLSMIQRKQLLGDLKSGPDAAKYSSYILYLEAAQAHEARYSLYVERTNLLLNVNKKRLNFVERIKLAAELALLDGQQTLAEQEMRESANRMKILASQQRLRDAEKNAERRRQKAELDAVLAAP